MFISISRSTNLHVNELSLLFSNAVFVFSCFHTVLYIRFIVLIVGFSLFIKAAYCGCLTCETVNFLSPSIISTDCFHDVQSIRWQLASFSFPQLFLFFCCCWSCKTERTVIQLCCLNCVLSPTESHIHQQMK